MKTNRISTIAKIVAGVTCLSAAAIAYPPAAAGATGTPTLTGQPSTERISTDWYTSQPSASRDPHTFVTAATASAVSTLVVVKNIGGRPEVTTVTARGGAAVVKAVTAAQADPRTLSIEIDKRVALPAPRPGAGSTGTRGRYSDPLRGEQWALDRLQAEEAGARSTGAGVKVAIIDTGVAHHPDLLGQIDDGFDFTGTGNNGRSDGHGHGTHVAGIMAATPNNGTGGAGLAPGIGILPIKVLTDEGWGYHSWVAQGITRAADAKVDVISMSLGGGESEAKTAAVKYAQSKGVRVVAAAGNDYCNPVASPGNVAGVMTIAATDRNQQPADFNSCGPEIELAAPGVDILSTVPPGDYASWSGTSMATPYASAAVAMLLSYGRSHGITTNPEQLLTKTATDLGRSGRDEFTGFGEINPLAGLKILAATPPSLPPAAPTGLTASGADKSAKLSWRAPLGSVPITGYQIEVRGPDGRWRTAVDDTRSVATAANIAGLTNGLRYTFRVSARNESIVGAAAQSESVLVVGAPTRPTSPVLRFPATHKVVLQWKPPSATGGAPITGYICRITGPNSTRFGKWQKATGRNCTFGGLKKGAKYKIEVVARNGAADSAPLPVSFGQAR